MGRQLANSHESRITPRSHDLRPHLRVPRRTRPEPVAVARDDLGKEGVLTFASLDRLPIPPEKNRLGHTGLVQVSQEFRDGRKILQGLTVFSHPGAKPRPMRLSRSAGPFSRISIYLGWIEMHVRVDDPHPGKFMRCRVRSNSQSCPALALPMLSAHAHVESPV